MLAAARVVELLLDLQREFPEQEVVLPPGTPEVAGLYEKLAVVDPKRAGFYGDMLAALRAKG